MPETPSASPPPTPPETPKALTLEQLRARITAAKTEQEHGQIAKDVIATGSQENLDAPTLKNWAQELQKLKEETVKSIGEKAENDIDDTEHLREVDKKLAILDARVNFLTELSKQAPETSSMPTSENWIERNFASGKAMIVKLFTNSKDATMVAVGSFIDKLPLATISQFFDQTMIFVASQMKDMPFIGEFAKNFIAGKEKKMALRDIGTLVKKANKEGSQPKIEFDEKVTELELETLDPALIKKNAASLILSCKKYENLPTITLTVIDFAEPQKCLRALDALSQKTPTPEQKKAVEDITKNSQISDLGTVILNTRTEATATKVDGKWNINVDANQFANGVPTQGSKADILKSILAPMKNVDSIQIIDANKPMELQWKPSKEIRVPSKPAPEVMNAINELFTKPNIHTGITTVQLVQGPDKPGIKIAKLESGTLIADADIPAAAFTMFSSVNVDNPTKKWEYKDGSWIDVIPSVPTEPAPKA